MPKNGKSSGARLLGPLRTPPDGKSLGAHRVEGVSSVSVSDPLGFGRAMKKGPGSQQRKQNHDVE